MTDALTEILANVLTGRVALQYEEPWGHVRANDFGSRRRWVMTDMVDAMPPLDREVAIGVLDTLATAVMLACDKVRRDQATSVADALADVPDACVCCGKLRASDRMEDVVALVRIMATRAVNTYSVDSNLLDVISSAALALGLKPRT